METIHALRRLDFPECTRTALDKLLAIFSRSDAIPGLATPIDDLAEHIVSEFIFCQTSSSKYKSATFRKFSALQALQVVEILLQFFNHQDDSSRNFVFKAVFAQASRNELSISILSKLVSLAVTVHNAPVLDYTAAWMQLQGCQSNVVKKLIESLILDYTGLVSGTISSLAQLPKLSRHFACNFITTVTVIYSLPGSRTGSGQDALPLDMLELISEWLTSDSELGIFSLTKSSTVSQSGLQTQRPTLWSSANHASMQTPIAGLMRWTTQALLVQIIAESTPKASTTNQSSVPDSSFLSLVLCDISERQRWFAAWSKLHLAVLQTLLNFPSMPNYAQVELITAADFKLTALDIVSLIGALPGGSANEKAITSVDRFVQILQVAFATGALRCSLVDLKAICHATPPCRLLQIVQSHLLSYKAHSLPNVVTG